MIGRTIDARPTFSLATVVFLLIAGLLVTLALCTANPHWLIAAILPALVALSIWWGRPQHVVFVVERDGLQTLGRWGKVYYADIECVTADGRIFSQNSTQIPAKVVELRHSAGCLVIPAHMNVDTLQFCRFVVEQLPPHASKPVPAVIAEHAEEQIAKFGGEKVQVIHTRSVVVEQWRRRRQAWICWSIILTGMIWTTVAITAIVVAPRREEFNGWLGAGALLGMVAFVVYVAQRATATRRGIVRGMRFPNSCIVISPVGLAMVQGELQGAMAWQEVISVTSRPSQWLRSSRIAGVQIRIRGGEILAADIYERSPAEIEALIRSNLQPQEMPSLT